MASKNSPPYSANKFKLNAQWLKRAASSLGSAGIDALSELTPNVAAAVQSTGSAIASTRKSALDTRRRSSPMQYILEQNKYIKLGKRGLDNILNDLKAGNFNNTSRLMGGGDDEESSGMFFGDMGDESDDGSGGRVTQYISKTDTEALNGISNSIAMQTKHQVTIGKAQIDSMVAVASSTMTQNQRNADAIVSELSNVNRGIQTLVAYNNENMTKFITAAMAYYDKAGSRFEPGNSDSASPSANPFGAEGGLNIAAYKDIVKSQFKSAFKALPVGEMLDMIKENGDMLVANPLGLISKGLMQKAIPEAMKSAMEATDKVFGSFMTEMVLQLGDRWKNASDGEGTLGKLIGNAKRIAAKSVNLNVDRKMEIDRGGKITTDAAVFDKIARESIIDEIPKYLRESTSYLRTMVSLMGGDPDKAVQDSEILNRASGGYQSYRDYTKEIVGSITDSISTVMDGSMFGKSLRRGVAGLGLDEDSSRRVDDAVKKFYMASEKNTKGSLKLGGEDSDLDMLLDEAGIDDDSKRVLRAVISGMYRSQNGVMSFNESRMRAKRSRNERLLGIESDNGIVRSSNVFGRGISTVDQAVAAAVYGKPNGQVGGTQTTRVVAAPTSLAGKLDIIGGLLERGINVKILDGAPFSGSASGRLGGYVSDREDDSTQQSQSNADIDARQSSDEFGRAASDISDDELRRAVDESLDDYAENKGSSGGRGAKAVHSVKQMMYYLARGNTAMATETLTAMFGDSITGIISKATDKLPDVGTHVKSTFKDILSDVKGFVFGDKDADVAEQGKGILTKGISRWKEVIFGKEDPDAAAKSLRDTLKERFPDTTKGALAGGLVGSLVGGPLFGALTGGAVGFANKSKGFQKLIFGNIIDDDGNVVGEYADSLISKEVQEYFKENKSDIVGGATIGGLMGTVVGGPLLGSLVGAGAGMLKKSKAFNEFVFGKIDDEDPTKRIGGIRNAFRDAMSQVTGKPSDREFTDADVGSSIAKGAGGGLLLSMFTPMGPVGGAVLGAATSIFASGDKFHEYLFGKKDNEGNTTSAGLFGRFTNTLQAEVLIPIKDKALEWFNDAKDKVIDRILDPFINALSPLMNLSARIYEATLGKLTKKIGDAVSGFGNMLKGLGKKALGLVTWPFRQAGKKLFGAITSVAGAGMRAIGGIAERSNQKASKKKFDKLSRNDQEDRIRGWTEEYGEGKEGFGSLDEFIEYKKRHEFWHKGSLGRAFGNPAERAAARAARDERASKAKELHNQSKLISMLTGGREVEVTEESKARALDKFRTNKRFVRHGKGIGGFTADEVFALLGSKPAGENGGGDSAQADKVQIEELPKLGMIAATLLEIKHSLFEKAAGGIRNARGKIDDSRIADTEERLGRNLTEYEKKAIRDGGLIRGGARVANDIVESARRESAGDTSVTDAINEERRSGLRYDGSQWHDAEKMARKWRNRFSFDKNVREATKQARLALFDDNGKRRSVDGVTGVDSAAELSAEAFDRLDAMKSAAVQNLINKKRAYKDRVSGAIHFVGAARRNLAEARARGGGNLVETLKRAYGTHSQHATGGTAKAGLAVVGERGPEIVRFNGGEKILSGQSEIKVRLESVSNGAAKTISENSAVQDVNIVGQQGLLTTYSTSAKLGSRTNDEREITQALNKRNTLVQYSNVSKDNDDYESENAVETEEKEGILSKILNLFGSNGVLSSIGNIALISAAGVGIWKFLQSDAGKAVLESLGSLLKDGSEVATETLKDAGKQATWTYENNAYSGGKSLTENAKAQVSRAGAILHGDMGTFMLGEDGEADALTTRFGRVGVLLADKILSGRRSSALLRRGGLASKFSPFVFASQYAKTGNLSAAIDSTNAMINPRRKGLSGGLYSLSDWATEKSDSLTRKLSQMSAEEAAETGARTVSKTADDLAESAVKSVMRSSGDDMTSLGARVAKESVDELATEAMETVVKSGASQGDDIAKSLLKAAAPDDIVSSTARRGGSATIVTKFGELVQKAFRFVGEKIAEKFPKISGAVTKALDVAGSGLKKLYNGTLGKLKKWIMEKIRNLLTKLGIDAGVAATGVGALAVLAKEGTWVCVGALNNTGVGGAARLFNCKQSDVDWDMIQISGSIGALLGCDLGAVVDVFNEIIVALTGADIICGLASGLYSLITGKGDDLDYSQERHRKDYELYQENYLNAEYQYYLQKNGLSESDMSLSDYKSKVANGEISSKQRSFNDWNEHANETWLGMLWHTMTRNGANTLDLAAAGLNTIMGNDEAVAENVASIKLRAAQEQYDLYSNRGKVQTPDSVKVRNARVAAPSESGTEAGHGFGGGKGGVPFYSQKDPRWANSRYSDRSHDETMADAGCGPSAVAMAVSGATGRDVLPTDTARVLKAVGARDNTGTNWSGISKAVGAYGIDSSEVSNPNAQFIDSAVNSGNSVIVSGSSSITGAYTPQGHYLVVTGKDRNGNYVVNDPNSMRGPSSYSKASIIKDAAKAWRVGGGRGAVTKLDDTADSVQSTGTGVTPADVIAVAMNEVGYLEKASNQGLDSKTENAGYNNYTKYGKYTGANGQYWCASFVSWCLNQACNGDESVLRSLIFGGKSASCATLEKQFINAGRYHTGVPSPGDIIFFTTDRSAKDGKAHHIGIVVEVDSKTVHTVEGNTSSGSNKVVANGGAVTTKSYTIGYNGIRGYGRPLYDGTSAFKGVSKYSSGTQTIDPGNSYNSGVSQGDSGESSGNIFGVLASWAKEFGSKVMNSLGGQADTDWSQWIAENSGTGMKSTYSGNTSVSSTGMIDSTGAASAAVAGAEAINLNFSDSDKTNARGIYNRLRGKGYGHIATSAMMGNFMAESHLQPGIKQIGGGPGRGLAQWSEGGRFDTLTKMAKEKGQDPYSMEPQVDFVDHEITNDPWMRKRFINRFGSVEGFKTTSDLEDATVKFERAYELAKNPDYAKRVGYAKSIAAEFGSDGNGGGRGGAANKPSPESMAVVSYRDGAEKKAKTVDEYLVEEGDCGYTPTAKASSRTTEGGRGAIAHGMSSVPRVGNLPSASRNMGTGQGSVSYDILETLKQVVNILSVSSDKLDNLELLSNLGNVSNTAITTNNISPNVINPSRVSDDKKPPKTTPDRFRVAEAIARG